MGNTLRATMSGNSYTYTDQGAHVAKGVTCTAGAAKGREGNAYGCNAEQRATMAELGLTLETAPRARGGKDEWEDALIKHKVMDAPLDHAKMRFMLQQKREDDAFLDSKKDHMAEKTLDELDELLEDDDDCEAAAMERYREARLAEMKEAEAKRKHNGLTHVTAQDYMAEVTNADIGTVVILHLYQEYVPECVRLNEVMNELSWKHKEVKWCKIKSTDANADYPDKALPTLLIYKDGQVLDRVVSLKTNGGKPVTADGLEWRLAQQGLIETTLEADPFADMSVTKMRVLHGREGRIVGRDDDSDEESD